MKSVLIITGPTEKFGTGHAVRMHSLALELKKHKVTVQHLVASPSVVVEMPLPYSLVILDRRDTEFNPVKGDKEIFKVAIDNRGPGREAADLVLDLLPHFDMNRKEYAESLQNLILRPDITGFPCASPSAKITLYNTPEEAAAAADFYPGQQRFAPREFSEKLKNCRRPALYFGQTLFEAIYLGLDVQLYPVTDYHKRLAVDLFARQLIENNLLNHVDGLGLSRVTEQLVQTLKKEI